MQSARPKVYIAGPMRGYPKLNFDAFYAATEVMRQHNFEVLNPAAIECEIRGWDRYAPDDFVPTQAELDEIIKRDLDIIFSLDPSNGDAVAVLPGWNMSDGAVLEVSLANFRKLAILQMADYMTPFKAPPKVNFGKVVIPTAEGDGE